MRSRHPKISKTVRGVVHPMHSDCPRRRSPSALFSTAARRFRAVHRYSAEHRRSRESHAD